MAKYLRLIICHVVFVTTAILAAHYTDSSPYLVYLVGAIGGSVGMGILNE